MKYLKWFFREIAQFRWNYVLVLFLQVVGVAFSLLYVWLSKALVDTAVAHFGGNAVEYGLTGLAVAFAGLSLARPVVMGWKSYLQSRMSVVMTNSLRQRIFDGLLKVRTDVGREYHSGDMLNRIETDVASVAGAFCVSVPNMFWAAIQFIAALVCVFYVNVPLAWTLLVVLPLSLPLAKLIMRRIRNLTLTIKSSDSKIQAYIQESVQHLVLLRTMEFTENSSEGLMDMQNENLSRNLKRIRFSILSRMIMSVAFTGGYLVAFLWGVQGISSGVVSYGLMTAMLQLVGQLQRPLIQASDHFPSILHSTASIDRIVEIEALPKEEQVAPYMVDGIAGIRLEHLSFAYPDGDGNVLNDISFDFRPGSRVALTGRTGIGKTTLMKTILALLSPDSGHVELYSDAMPEGVDVSPATRCNFAYVPQGNTLFSGSVRDNLLMGDSSASEDRLREVLHLAMADFVYALPDGLDTVCSEAGGGLSEGQAQRIAIARALLRPGSILLLDEFSSALDPQTEEEMLARLTAKGGIAAGKTMIFITHREKVLDYCDSVLKLD